MVSFDFLAFPLNPWQESYFLVRLSQELAKNF